MWSDENHGCRPRADATRGTTSCTATPRLVYRSTGVVPERTTPVARPRARPRRGWFTDPRVSSQSGRHPWHDLVHGHAAVGLPIHGCRPRADATRGTKVVPSHHADR